METNALSKPAWIAGLLFASILAAYASVDEIRLSTAPYDPKAQFRAVHIDTLDPFLQPLFEESRREWLKVLASHHTSDGRGFMFQLDRHTLVTLRSFNSFTEYDALRDFRASIDKRLGDGGEARRTYDSGDVALRTPHNSEIWERDTDLDYRGNGNPISEYTAGYMQMVVEHVDSNEYGEAWKEIAAALEKAKYPLPRITFSSTLGSGNEISLWLAPDRKAFEEAGTPFHAVEKVLGTARTQALFQRYKAASSELRVHDLIPRPELKSPE